MARIRRQGQSYQANFSLKGYGNWNAAMAAGRTWVERLAKNLPPRLFSKGQMTSRNTSGVVGVHLHVHVIRKGVRRKRRYEYRSWIARWPGCNYRGGVKWSVKKFGEDDAFVLAALCRRMETEARATVLDALNDVKTTDEYGRLLSLRKK